MVQIQLSPPAFAQLFNPDTEDVLRLGNIPKAVSHQSTYPLDTRHFLWCWVKHSPNAEYLIREISRWIPQEYLCNETHRSPVSLTESSLCHSALNALAERFLTELILPFRGFGERTPSSSNTDSGISSPLIDDTFEHEVAALEVIAPTNPEAMKTLVALRDGDRCLLTGHGFSSVLAPSCTHIIPFSIHCRERSHDLIELFTSGQVSGVEIRDKFHSPCNALMLQSDAQDCFNMLVWGIEAVQDPATQNWKYSYRLVNPESVDDIIEVADGQELPFGSGPGNQPQSPSPTQHDIELPDPTFCNLHLAISRIAHESGASKIADELCEAWESDRRAERRVVAPGMNNRVGGNGRNGLDADALWYKLKELQVHPEEGCSGEEDDDDSVDVQDAEQSAPGPERAVKAISWEGKWKPARGRTPEIVRIS